MRKKTRVGISAKAWRNRWQQYSIEICGNRRKGFICCRAKFHLGSHLFRDDKYEVEWGK